MNFNFLIEQNILWIIFIILIIVIILIVIDIFKFFRKEGRGVPLPKGFTENELFLKISEEFYNQLKKGIETEIKNNLLEFRKEIEKTSQEIIKIYQSRFEKEDEEIKKIFSEISQQIFIGAEEIRKQIDIFGQKTQEEISQLLESNLEIQKKILENAENKISQLEDVAKREVLKIGEIASKTRELLLEETKRQSEIFSRELSQKISQIYQWSGETLKEKIKKTEEEIENYKKERFKEMERKIYLMLGKIAKKTIGRAVDLSTHEKLVMDALEKVKKEMF